MMTQVHIMKLGQKFEKKDEEININWKNSLINILHYNMKLVVKNFNMSN